MVPHHVRAHADEVSLLELGLLSAREHAELLELSPTQWARLVCTDQFRPGETSGEAVMFAGRPYPVASTSVLRTDLMLASQ